jgi:small GTP-binding protein
MPETQKLQEKIVLLGDPSVGKTSLIKRYVHNEFSDKYVSTLGTKVSKKTIVFDELVPNKIIELNLMIWDVMGQDEYEMFHKSAFVGAQGALIVSDISRRETILNWQKWNTNLCDIAGIIPLLMIGNKNDLANGNNIGHEEMESIAKLNKAPLYFTSAKTGENVEDVFRKLGEAVLKHILKIKDKDS